MAKIQVERRRVIQDGRVGNAATLDAPADGLGVLLVSQAQAPRAVRAAAGARYIATMGVGSTFIGSTTAYPGTTVQMALWNGESPGGKSYFLDRLWAIFISGTSALGATLFAGVTQSNQTQPTASTGTNGGYALTVVGSLSGRGVPGGTKAALVNNPTLIGPLIAWAPVAHWDGTNATTTIANQNLISDDLQGGIVVPPQNLLCINVVEAAGTSPLWSYGAEWTEYQADLE